MPGGVYRVAPGGFFHVPKVKYSRETEALIRDLIRESKLSIFQRRKVEESVKNGEALPLPPSKTERGMFRQKPDPEEHIRYLMPRRRKHSTIEASGAYKLEPFIPCYDKPNREVEKANLQEKMAFGKILQTKKSKDRCSKTSQAKKNEEDDPKKFLEEIMQEAYNEIEERKTFLEEMAKFGEEKNYKDIIEQEIAEKLRLILHVEKRIQELDKRQNV